MNKLLIATAFTALASSATAAEVTRFVSLEYATESETTELSVGIDATFGQFTVTPEAALNDDGQDFDFAGAEVTVAYELTSAASAYVNLEADADFNHTETTVGVAFSF